jgi:hypothetical protein
MKFIWNEPKPDPSSNKTLPYPQIFWDHAILGWLESNRVFLGEKYNHKHYEIHYNYMYHFFDIYVYDQSNNHGIRKTFKDYLSTTKLNWTEISTFRWENHNQIEGSRFWIQAEDFPLPK